MIVEVVIIVADIHTINSISFKIRVITIMIIEEPKAILKCYPTLLYITYY